MHWVLLASCCNGLLPHTPPQGVPAGPPGQGDAGGCHRYCCISVVQLQCPAAPALPFGWALALMPCTERLLRLWRGLCKEVTALWRDRRALTARHPRTRHLAASALFTPFLPHSTAFPAFAVWHRPAPYKAQLRWPLLDDIFSSPQTYPWGFQAP